jgi:hypothetical protein
MQVLFVAGCLLSSPPNGTEAPDFNRDVRPILANKCLACHGADEKHREAGLRLDDRSSATKKLESGVTAIIPGKTDGSELLRRVKSHDDDERMPPKGNGEQLTPKEIAVLERWIAAGADYAPHWSFVPPKKVQPPPVLEQHRRWVRNPVDAFTLHRMTRRGLSPSPEAERGALLRRVSFDLIGLPPTKEQLDAFLADDGEGAFEKAVDRLLADPGYGERWARVWLDLARYADSAGYGSDPLRTIWRYRDWVIDAHNRNLPFDEFTKLQLAGDLKPKPTLDDLVATAFHRNTMTNTEGGTDDEEFRVAAVKDRTDVTMQVWMGLTVGCAKCHSHKFDPISHHEYYRLFAFFNQTADADLPNETPTLPAPTANQRRENERIDAEVARLRAKLKGTSPELAAKHSIWEKELLPRPDHPWKPASIKAASESGRLRLTTNATEGTTAVRLEMPTAANGEWSLSEFQLETSKSGLADKPMVGRYVRIDLPGKKRMLHIAEVEVLSAGTNIARKGTARQSSTYLAAGAKRAIDGNRDGKFDKGSTTHTNGENNPWWEVDLNTDAPIERIGVWNRTDGDVGKRLKGWTLSILDKDRKVVWKTVPAEVPATSAEFAVDGWKPLAVAAVKIGNEPAQPWPAKSLSWKSKAGAKPLPLTFILANPLAKEATAVRISAKLTGKLDDKLTASVTTDPTMTRRGLLPSAVAAALESADRSSEQRRVLSDYFREQVAGKPLQESITKLEASRPKPATVPVMKELPNDKRRVTKLLEKGNFLQPGETVTAEAPSAFHPWPAQAPKDRAGLAEWLMARDNPLTARVAVNRLWARLFGRGLVETEEDFGVQGEHPSHPELLDWLANEYVRSGWNTKAMLRLMTTSATYRQSTKTTPIALEKDPDNRWLSRFPRLRLEAEMVRDQALAASGKLVRKIGGPSVFPPQPDGLWQAAFNGERTWPTSVNSDRYRRGLYVFWRRTIPYPSMAAFDAPSRETCTLRRKSTNTPIQAFVTLNDPVHVELARSFAKRILAEGGSSAEERARFGLRVATCREPTSQQTEVVVRLVENSVKSFNAEDAKKWGGEPPAGVSPQDFAAWTLAANALMNLDAFLTKG